jgi:hypothetical protein
MGYYGAFINVEFGRKVSWPILRYYMGILPAEQKETMKNFRHNSEIYIHDLNQ